MNKSFYSFFPSSQVNTEIRIPIMIITQILIKMIIINSKIIEHSLCAKLFPGYYIHIILQDSLPYPGRYNKNYHHNLTNLRKLRLADLQALPKLTQQAGEGWSWILAQDC